MLYEKIECLSEEQDISIPALERRANVGNGVISGWKQRSPRLRTLKKVAKALGVEVTELLDDGQEVD